MDITDIMDIVAECQLIMKYLKNAMTVEEIKNTAFPHPTVSEAIREAVFR